MLWTLLAPVAWASSLYPTDLVALLDMPCPPPCTVCHTSLGGGAGTVTAELGIALMDRGLTGGSASASLETAVAALVADGVDSDGDGTPDADALAAGQDPNPDGVDFCASDVLTPRYGCGASTRPGAALEGLVVGVAAAAVWLRRRSAS